MWAGRSRLVVGLSAGLVFTLIFLAGAVHGDVDPVDARERGIGNSSEGARYVSNEIIVKYKKSAADKLTAGLSEGKKVNEVELGGTLDNLHRRCRVKRIEGLFPNFKERMGQIEALKHKDKGSLSKREERLLRRGRRAPKGVRVPELDRIYKLEVELEEGESLEDVVAAYNSDRDVEYAELNYIVSICATPNDPLYPIQWALSNTGQMYPESGKYNSPPGTDDCDIDAPEAWDIHTGSSDVIVAVVDTGVDYNHRDLDDNMWTDGSGHWGYDFINDDADPIDDHGHGTHCAGIIAAEGDNSLDVTGVCWDAKIMALKFLDETGSGSTSDATEAFYYAVDNGADVVSNSWGGSGYSQSMQDAIDYAYSQGVIMVAAAGNDNCDNSDYYPANYEHVISVAATDSNDQKAGFSNYGDWVDIAAPGVDILSLRASGTSMGSVYDSYTTIASGTSMACPHVAGVCALLVSSNPLRTSDEIYDILIDTVDPIADGICLADGRLNLFSAIPNAISSRGGIIFNRNYYSCSDEVAICLADYDLAGVGSQEVRVTTSGGDLETVVLTERTPPVGVFTGAISTTSESPNTEDGLLQLSDGEIMTVTYEDSDDGNGNPATVMDTAESDCVEPVIFNVVIDVTNSITVSFETDEPTTGCVKAGLICDESYAVIESELVLQTHHTIRLIMPSPATTYYVVIDATDKVGNKTFDDNGGLCYEFTSPPPLRVPSNYPTIQNAIDSAFDGNIILVADGTYTGSGNRDISFEGKAITVTSENGADNCIIDCQGEGRGFHFRSNERHDSILDGFTIMNGLASDGAGIYCYESSPMIINCRIIGNTVQDSYGVGGGILLFGTSATITDCLISGNSSSFQGGGIYSEEYGSVKISNCVITGNSTTSENANVGGGIATGKRTDVSLSNCIISENSSGEHGGGIACVNTDHNFSITNCTIINNSAIELGGGMLCSSCKPRIVNSILRNNTAPTGSQVAAVGSAINPDDSARVSISYSNIQEGQEGIYIRSSNASLDWGDGNIDADPLFVTGPLGDYYLSQVAAGQGVNSPCVDAGSDTAVNLGMDTYTTRSDELADVDIVDMGYHYSNAMVINPDVSRDGRVDLVDFGIVSGWWMDSLCNGDNSFCGKADINFSGDVNLDDLFMLAGNWLAGVCFPAAALGPYPADGASGVKIRPELSWSAGDCAVSHDVYFGTSSPGEFQGNQISFTFDPGPLDFQRTYYWRIDEVQGDSSVVEGDVWKFTTRSDMLVGWWELDESEGGMAYDSSANGYDGTLNGDPTWWPSDGKIGGALEFDGDGDYVEVVGYKGISGSNPRTVTAWVRVEPNASILSIVRWGTMEINGGLWSNVINADGKLRAAVWGGSVVGGTTINDNTWHHVAIVLPDKEDVKVEDILLYVDGGQEDTTISLGSQTIDTVVGMDVLISYAGSFDGLLDDVRIYNYALSEEEIGVLAGVL